MAHTTHPALASASSADAPDQLSLSGHVFLGSYVAGRRYRQLEEKHWPPTPAPLRPSGASARTAQSTPLPLSRSPQGHTLAVAQVASIDSYTSIQGNL